MSHIWRHSAQVMLVLDNPDYLPDEQLAPLEGLQLSSITADRGQHVHTDLVVSVNLR
jgi:hypothetical protein